MIKIIIAITPQYTEYSVTFGESQKSLQSNQMLLVYI